MRRDGPLLQGSQDEIKVADVYSTMYTSVEEMIK